MVQITLTLTQLNRFLKKLSPSDLIRGKAIKSLVPVLEDSLLSNVYTNHNDTVIIKNKNELRRLIRSKGKGKKGAPYNQQYLSKKMRMGELYPHKYMEYGFATGTSVKKEGNSVVMKTAAPTNRKKFGNFKDGSENYLEYHEKNRSVLKLAFLRGWQSVVNSIIKVYADEALKC